MDRSAPDAAGRWRRPGRMIVALLVAGAAVACASPAGPDGVAGQPMTTTTVATTSSSAAAGSSGPGVQPSFETGVPDAVVSFVGGLPSGETRPVAAVSPSDEVRRGADGDLLVVTWGSTTCPRMPVSVTAVDLTTIEIVTGTVRVDPDSNAEQVPETTLCINDLGPTTSTVRLPDGAAGAGRLTVVVDGATFTVA